VAIGDPLPAPRNVVPRGNIVLGHRLCLLPLAALILSCGWSPFCSGAQSDLPLRADEFPEGRGLAVVVFPESLLAVGQGAFAYCHSLVSADLGSAWRA
jgi:hypothetical protein